MHYRRDDDAAFDDERDERFDAESAAGPAAESSEFLTEDDRERLERCAPEIALVLDALAGVGEGAGSDPSWDGADTLAVVKGLEAAGRALEHAQAQTVARLDRDVDTAAYGYAKVTSLLRSRLKITLREARRRDLAAKNLAPRTGLTGARIPTRFPRLAAGLADGTFSVDQVQAAVQEIEALPEPLRAAYEQQVEATLASVIAPLEVADIRAVGKRIRDYLDPDGDFDEPRYRRSDLYLTVRQLPDGSWEIKGRIDAPTGLIINNLSTNKDKTAAELVSAADRLAATQAGEHGSGCAGARCPDCGQPTGHACVGKAASLGGDRESAGGGDKASSETADRGAVDSTACPGQGELWNDQGVTVQAGTDESGHAGREDSDGNTAGSDNPGSDMAGTDNAGANTAGTDKAGSRGPVEGSAFTLPGGANAIDADGNPANIRSFDHRSEGLRRHDRFAQLIRRAALTTPAGAAFALVVTATAEEYARGKGEVEAAGGHLRLEDLKDLSPGGMFYYQSARPGSKKINVRSESRFVTRRQLALITARDRGCTFPGCDMPSGWCEAHHMVPWSDGGPTDVANLTLACGWHHRWHDKHGWRAELIDGLPAWIPPTHVDSEQTPLFHSRFLAQRAAITGILAPPGPAESDSTGPEPAGTGESGPARTGEGGSADTATDSSADTGTNGTTYPSSFGAAQEDPKFRGSIWPDTDMEPPF